MGAIYHQNVKYGGIPDTSKVRITLSQAEYDALPLADKQDLTKVYYCPDAPNVDDVVFPRYEQNVLGAKNLFTYPYYATTKTENGVTFTDNGDGTITVNGTATADITFVLSSSYDSFTFQEGDYTISGCPEGGSSSTYLIRYTLRDLSASVTTWYEDIGEGSQFTQTSNIKCHYSEIKIFTGTVCNNLVFKPMIRLESDPDDTFAPYAMTNTELTGDAKHDIFTGTLELKTGVTNVAFYARKVGHIIFIHGILQKNVTANSWNELCVFPVGYRPTNLIRPVASNSTDDIAILSRIDTDGTFAVYPVVSKTINVAFCFTYFEF